MSLGHAPRRIASLQPSATVILAAISELQRVVACTRYCADVVPEISSSSRTIIADSWTANTEEIVATKPDLVIAADDTAGLVHGLGALNISVLIEPAAKNVDESYKEIEQLGVATGHVADAGSLEKRMRSDLAAIVASIPTQAKQFKVYHELDDTYYSATSATFIGQAYALLNLKNIADGATAASGDYPQLSAEYIVASSPDLIVLADTKCCHQNLTTVSSRPGWSSIAAVKSGQVIGVDDDVASRWGPRVIDFLRALAPHVKQLEGQAA